MRRKVLTSKNSKANIPKKFAQLRCILQTLDKKTLRTLLISLCKLKIIKKKIAPIKAKYIN